MNLTNEEQLLLDKLNSRETLTDEEMALVEDIELRAKQAILSEISEEELIRVNNIIPRDKSPDFYLGALECTASILSLLHAVPTLYIPESANNVEGRYIQFSDFTKLMYVLTAYYSTLEDDRLGNFTKKENSNE